MECRRHGSLHDGCRHWPLGRKQKRRLRSNSHDLSLTSIVCSFAIGWLGVTWLYPAEVTPMRIRAEANGLSTSANWLFNYAVVQLSPIMINSIAWNTYFVFMCFNFAFIPVVYYTFVDTNGYKLETMDEISTLLTGMAKIRSRSRRGCVRESLTWTQSANRPKVDRARRRKTKMKGRKTWAVKPEQRVLSIPSLLFLAAWEPFSIFQDYVPLSFELTSTPLTLFSFAGQSERCRRERRGRKDEVQMIRWQ